MSFENCNRHCNQHVKYFHHPGKSPHGPFLKICFFHFNFGSAGSSLLCRGFVWLWRLGLWLLWSTSSRHRASVVVARGLSCPEACGIFPEQGSHACPLHWQVEAPLRSFYSQSPSLTPSPGNYCPLSLPFPECCINEITQFIALWLASST